MINQIIQFIKNRKLISFGLILFIVVIVIYLIQSITPKTNKSTTTVPVINTNTPGLQTQNSTVLPKQKLVFNWNNIKIDLPSSSKKYLITKPLVNKDTITQLAQDLGFLPEDLLKSVKSTSRTWNNNNGSLFSSIDQNQIIFSGKVIVLPNTSTVTKEEAISTSNSIISTLFGNDFINTLNNTPQVRFLKYNPANYNPTTINNPQEAEYIEVSYKQSLDSHPLSSLSGNTSIVTVVINNQKNLFRLEISGGYLENTSQGEQSIVDINSLKINAPAKALKISSLPDVSLESSYLNLPNININVNSVVFGYFLTNENYVVPVVFVSGTASGNNFSAQQITYVVPVSKD
jgi:hypothetical protein